jgi:hypothetical protein
VRGWRGRKRQTMTLKLLFCTKSEIHLSCGTYFLGPTKVRISDFLDILYLRTCTFASRNPSVVGKVL